MIINTLYTTILKMLQQDLAMPTAPDPESLENSLETTMVANRILKNSKDQPIPQSIEANAQVAGIDPDANELHLTDGRIYQITSYMDPYGRVCEPEDACTIEAMIGAKKIKVEFYSTRYTKH